MTFEAWTPWPEVKSKREAVNKRHHGRVSESKHNKADESDTEKLLWSFKKND